MLKRLFSYIHKILLSNEQGELPTEIILDEPIPDEVYESIADVFYPSILKFFESEEGKRIYAEWKAKNCQNT